MVDHVRKQIRDAAVTDLTGLSTTGANVFTSRLSPLDESKGEIPGWYVMLRDEAAADDAVGTFARTGQLVLEGWALAEPDDLEDLLDRMAAEAEAALYGGDSNLLALLMNWGPPQTQMDTPEAGTIGRTLGKIRILIPVTYRTAITDPTTLA